MHDSYNRKIDYLRISVTDKCNLRCVYCMPEDGVIPMNHDDILSLEEILRICTAAAKLGIQKIKITGGEPLVRKGIIELIGRIKKIEGIKQVTLTTNGILLNENLDKLIEIGIDAINISIDTLEPERYAQITGFPYISKVLSSLDSAVKAGIAVKVNCVPSLELNQDQIIPIAMLAKKYPVDVKFIELMPIGYGKKYNIISNHEIKTQLENYFGKFIKSNKRRGNGPAQYYTVNNLQGCIGFISAVSHGFCENCSRIRLTCDGMLKLCLHYNNGISLKGLMRSGISDEALGTAIKTAVLKKPQAHNFTGKTEEIWEKKNMYQIGG